MSIVIEVSDDRMQTIAGVERPSDDALEPGTLQRALADAHVTYGIDEAACNEFVTAIIKPTPGRKAHIAAGPARSRRRRH
jgi:hypothetical protein